LFIGALFALHALFALALLIGWQTRAATFACAVMQWSLVSRNPMLCHSGDGLCAWLLIWGLFLPLGAVGSIDSRTGAARKAPPPPRTISSVATAALLLQVVFLYWCAAASKSSPDWRINHSAVYRFLVCHIGTPLGHDLSRFHGVCEWLTVATLFLETFAPAIALLSAPLPWLRVIIALGFMVFHLCLVATLYVGTFAFVCMIAWFAYLPSEFWDALERWRPIRAVHGAWARLVDAGAAMLLRAAPLLAVSRTRTQAGWVGTIVASLLLAHVTLVNLVQAFGAPLPSHGSWKRRS
jgi:hypothetical protein